MKHLLILMQESEHENRIEEDLRTRVRAQILRLMLMSSAVIQKQLIEAIGVIGDSDFPTKWPEISQQIIAEFKDGNINRIECVLRALHRILYKYEVKTPSQKGCTEMKRILHTFFATA